MRTVILLTVAAIALCACETAPGRAPARVAEHHPTGAETAQRGTAMQVSLDKVSNPEGRLAHASVQDKNGTTVGTVQRYSSMLAVTLPPFKLMSVDSWEWERKWWRSKLQICVMSKIATF